MTTEKDSLTLMYGSATGFAFAAALQLVTHQFGWALFSGLAAGLSLAWALHRRKFLSHPQNPNSKE